ncbi:TetR family transcriptional regulator [Hyphomonas adhaerens MHS-3]|uniref:TetR family transcriptional regulator n=2 Tax=Hyphomonas adhaerens TaxID=81029 RepID=A0A069E3N4_9PROT|nr:TetR family transcriptional regulator [Hyphomonas adhaerens MHS-3]
MTSDDNTVNMKPREGRYHHGDLRSALIEEGLAQLDVKAPDAVSLREIARNVGVSATAVYRHFPDKAALLSALCGVGGERLAEAFREAMSGADEQRAAFRAMGRAYVKFALRNPSVFRLMMTQRPPEGDRNETPCATDEPFGMLSDTLNALMPADTSHADRKIKRLQAWSMVHGLAMLMLDGQVPRDEALVDQVIVASFL